MLGLKNIARNSEEGQEKLVLKRKLDQLPSKMAII